MTEPPLIERLSTDHAASLVDLSKSLASDPFPCSFWGLDEAAVESLVRHPTRESIVLQHHGVIVGVGTTVRGTEYQRHLAEISVAVHPEHRRQGVARSLAEDLERRARQSGVELLKALIWTKNPDSQSTFEALGYQRRSVLYCEFKSEEYGEIDDFVYYKRLETQINVR